MAISKEIYNAVINGINNADNNEEHEFESVLTQKNGISKSQFSDVHNYLMHSSLFNIDKTTDNNTLDISIIHTNYRVTIVGTNNMNDFCKTNTITDGTSVNIIEKGKIKDFDTIKLLDYDLYFKMRFEKNIENKENLLPLLKTHNKHFRHKKRFSFIHVNKSFRVDLTVVRMSERPAKSVLESGVLQNLEKFEIEVEYLQEKTKLSLDKKVEDMFAIIDGIKQVLEDTSFLMTHSEKEMLLCDYLKMINPNVFVNCNYDILGYIKNDVLQNPKSFFLSYQPVTLEQENVLPPELGKISIQDDYSVTEKADGERMLLYVDKNNNMYMINSRLSIKKIGNKHKYSNCLVDGEFIKKSSISNTLYNTLLIFDIYFINGIDVRNKVLVPHRIDYMKDFLKNLSGKNEINIKEKKHHHGDDIFKLARNLYNSSKYEYHIDGLIFTPINLAVGAYYKGETVETNTFGGTWARTFKWKPPDENSIDMLTTYGSERFLPDLGRCVFAQLKVAYNPNADMLIDPYAVLSHAKIFQKRITESRTFIEVYIPLKDEDKKPRTQLGEIIYNDTIIEYIYDPKDSGLMSWKPYRVRDDKTTLYKTSKRINGTANNYNTAMNVWRSIINPVTSDIITGKVTLTSSEISQNNVYYSRNVSRKKILSKPMLEFHNKAIKSYLFNLFKNKKYNLIDLASGKGGDLYKWFDAGFTNVVGIDINLDNIMNNNDGAYKRLYKSNRNDGKRTNVIFLQKDVSEAWSDINSIENETMFDLYKLVSRNEKPKPSIPHNISKFKNILNNNFDVVSCQFAIHYMFENENKLNTFCKNVDDVLKPGGYFIGTCLDGLKVANLLDKSETGKRIGEQDGNVLWMVEKKYEGDFQLNTTGQTISVYMESINKIFDEYLVDITYLEAKLSKYNIKVLSKKEEKDLDLKQSIGNFELVYNEIEYSLSDTLKKYSFLNTWFVFKKY